MRQVALGLLHFQLFPAKNLDFTFVALYNNFLYAQPAFVAHLQTDFYSVLVCFFKKSKYNEKDLKKLLTKIIVNIG